jgi:hypothetical protein
MMPKMSALQVSTTNEHFLISLDRHAIKRESLLRLLNLFRMEMLAENVNFDLNIEALGEEIVADWWEKNKATYLGEHA